MTFEESFEKVSNRIRSFHEVDRSRFYIDCEKGVMNEWNLIWKINSILNGRGEGEYVIQCPCGRLDLVNKEIFVEYYQPLDHTDENSIKCSKCNKFDYDFDSPLEVSPKITSALYELEKVFQKAEAENYMTLCWYLWQSLTVEREQLAEMQSTVDLIFDQYIKNNFEIFLQKHKLSTFRVGNEYHHGRQYILCLLALNHIFELEGLYDLVVSLVAIAESEQYLIGDDGHSVHPVGLKITKPEKDEKRDKVKYKIAFLKAWLRERKYMKLAKLIQIAFNCDLRNAFSHSEYKLSETGIYLTKYKREISYKNIEESFLAAYFFLSMITSRIAVARNRFIESKGYTEAGWKIVPHFSENGFSVQLTGNSVEAGPTGFKRRKPSKDSK